MAIVATLRPLEMHHRYPRDSLSPYTLQLYMACPPSCVSTVAMRLVDHILSPDIESLAPPLTQNCVSKTEAWSPFLHTNQYPDTWS